ncbi:MAG: peptide deformylase [Candidatus Pacebacteria bacterium]|nr:peptide deformylase [Candidatus Paceibacterota bacterium]MCD8508125.1 peptide deformylase [Candidatus Paceibacterota bacterium]MCD8527919.1 peptide deformylase [Candidatus Paceibacterota bacterium]MCD8563761.1 peptide deformylase [Candidatus Paceibacterota bacterium]
MSRIVQKGHPCLRGLAQPVNPDDITDVSIQKIIEDMHATLAQEEDGVALAAPQIGVSLRIFVVSPKGYSAYTPDKPLVFINPEIIKHAKKRTVVPEGCLSVRWWYGKTRRYGQATVRAYNEHGELFEYGGSGLLAQIFQHEIDHLNGILFDDHAHDLYELDQDERP